MSRQLKFSLPAAFGCLLICAGITSAKLEVPQALTWEATWQDKSAAQTTISITEKNGFVDVSGKDAASIYACTGIIEKNLVECFGSGVNHQTQKRFLYNSQLRISEDRQTIEESWEALFADRKKLSGKTVFSRRMPQEN